MPTFGTAAGIGATPTGVVNDREMAWRYGRLWLPWTVCQAIHVDTELTTSAGAGASVVAALGSGHTDCYGLPWSAAGDYVEYLINLHAIEADLDRTFYVQVDSMFSTADNTATYKAFARGIADGEAIEDLGTPDGTVTLTELAAGTAFALRQTNAGILPISGLLHTVVDDVETTRDAYLLLRIEADAIEAAAEIFFLGVTLLFTRQMCVSEGFREITEDAA